MSNLNSSYDSTLEQSRNMQGNYVKFLAEFTAFDASLNAAYGTQWLADQKLAEGQATDEMQDDEQAGFDKVVKDRTADCMEAINDLKYYARKAYGLKSPKYAEYGFNRISKNTLVTHRFIILVKTAHVVATEFTTELLAAGMSAAQILAVLNTARVLETAEIAYQRYMLSRPRLKANRDAAILKMVEYMRRLSSASEALHNKIPEKRKLFLVGGGE